MAGRRAVTAAATCALWWPGHAVRSGETPPATDGEDPVARFIRERNRRAAAAPNPLAGVGMNASER